MAFEIEQKLVIAVASSALFDLRESHEVFVKKGEKAYREYQRRNENSTLRPGVAFPFVRRLLQLNTRPHLNEPVEVVLLSRNDPDTGLRVFKSAEKHKLNISRGAFVSGQSPYRYIDSFNASLFLSANKEDVEAAIAQNLPAGRVLDSEYVDDDDDNELRVAFDFDGVLAGDESERVFSAKGLLAFQTMEQRQASKPHDKGPLHGLLAKLAALRKLELQHESSNKGYRPMLRIAIITARNAPAHERFVTTLRQWQLNVDETFFLGGIEKRRVLQVFRPHIFFDDQEGHLTSARGFVPAVHVPFGVANRSGPNVQASRGRGSRRR